MRIAASLIALWIFAGCKSQQPKDPLQKREAAAFQVAIAQLRESTGAGLDWEKSLSDEDRLFSIDVERAWMTGTATAFRGRVVDVATVDPDDYQVAVDIYSDVTGADLQLRLTCPRSIVDPAIPKLRMYEDVVTAARIKRVIRSERQDSISIDWSDDKDSAKGVDGGTISATTVFTGDGICLDLITVPDAHYDPSK